MNPYSIVKDFEKAIGEYTAAPYVCCVNSCTAALFLCLKYVLDKRTMYDENWVEIPKHTYISVPMQIMHAGGHVFFNNEHWTGGYQLKPFDIYDYARRFTSGMYKPGTFQAVSFQATKILGIEHGGAILHDDPLADKWFRKARYDGRTEGVHPTEDNFTMLGYHCHMAPSTAAVGLLKLASLPLHNPDLPADNYPDLSQFEIFK